MRVAIHRSGSRSRSLMTRLIRAQKLQPASCTELATYIALVLVVCDPAFGGVLLCQVVAPRAWDFCLLLVRV